MEPATVLETRPDEAVVEADGRSVVLPNFFVPDLRPGESVVIGMGHILGRLSAADAAELRDDRALAYGGVPDGTVAPDDPGRRGEAVLAT